MKIVRWEVSNKALVTFLCGLLMFIIFAVSLFLRVYPTYGSVFAGDWVRFQDYDPWYHLRLAENTLHHLPEFISFDPYLFYPHGQSVGFGPLFDLLVAAVAGVVGWGSPSQQALEAVAAYLPAVLGALITVPVYFLGRALYNRLVGLIAAALTAVVPGIFLLHSLLGYTDYYALASLLSVVTILMFVLALRSASGKDAWALMLRGRWEDLRRPLLYTLLAGIALGLYLISWAGGLFLVFILFCYILLQHVIDQFRGRPCTYLSFIGVISFVVALLIVLPFLHQGGISELHLVSPLVAIAAFLVASAVSLGLRRLSRYLYPLALIVLALVGVGGLYLVSPSFFRSIMDGFQALGPQGASATSEMSPLLFPQGLFSLTPAWDDFTVVFFVALIALVLLFINVLKEWKAEGTLFLVWSLAMLAATLSQRRFGYYFAVNAALLSAYLTWQVLEWSRPRKAVLRRSERRRGERLAARVKKRPLHQGLGWGYILVAAIAAVALFYPNIARAVTVAKGVEGPNKDWHDSLVWMRENTPEPFGDAAFYYQMYEAPPTGADDKDPASSHAVYEYPSSAYGVMCGGSFSYWVASIAHRITVTGPGQVGALPAARFFLAQDEPSADSLMATLGARYVVVDLNTAISRFPDLYNAAGESSTRFIDQYYLRTPEGSLTPVPVFYPDYYRSMSSRLYNFGGKAVVPDNTSWVISFTEKKDAKGKAYKEISGYQSFATYEEAQAFLKAQSSPNFLLVGIDPFQSPVPLEELEGYKLIYHSETIVAQPSAENQVSYVDIFERVPTPEPHE